MNLGPIHVNPRKFNPTYVYVVGTVAHSFTDKNGVTTYSFPLYYIDTSNDPDYENSRFSNHFTSSTNPYQATKFTTYEEALAWKTKHFDDEPQYVIFKFY